jgi:hypothetical protein
LLPLPPRTVQERATALGFSSVKAMGISLSNSRALRLRRLAAAAARVALPATLHGNVGDAAEDAGPGDGAALSGAEDAEGDADVSDADDGDEEGDGEEDKEGGEEGEGEGEGGDDDGASAAGSEAAVGAAEEDGPASGAAGDADPNSEWCALVGVKGGGVGLGGVKGGGVVWGGVRLRG